MKKHLYFLLISFLCLYIYKPTKYLAGTKIAYIYKDVLYNHTENCININRKIANCLTKHKALLINKKIKSISIRHFKYSINFRIIPNIRVFRNNKILRQHIFISIKYDIKSYKTVFYKFFFKKIYLLVKKIQLTDNIDYIFIVRDTYFISCLNFSDYTNKVIVTYNILFSNYNKIYLYIN